LVLSTAVILVIVSFVYGNDSSVVETLLERQERLLNSRRDVSGLTQDVLTARLMETGITSRDADESIQGFDVAAAAIRRRLAEFENDPGAVEIVRDSAKIRAFLDEAESHVDASVELSQTLGLSGANGALQRFERLEDALSADLTRISAAFGDAFVEHRMALRRFVRTRDMGLADGILTRIRELEAKLQVQGHGGDSVVQRLDGYRQELSVFFRGVLQLLRTRGKGRIRMEEIGPILTAWERALDDELEAVTMQLAEHRGAAMRVIGFVLMGGLLVLWMLYLAQRRVAMGTQRRVEKLTRSMGKFAADGQPPELELLAQSTDNVGALSRTFASMAARLSAQIDTIRAERERADAASRVKSQFLANVSHEIRTPMNGVLGMLQLLERTHLDSDQQEYVSTIRASGDGLLTLINDLLDYSKIEAGRLDLEEMAFDVTQTVQSVVRLLRPAATERGLRLVCRIADEVPTSVLGDPGRLRQVLTNLLGNALKFTRAGCVDLNLGWVREKGDRIAVRFEVRDTGIGIRPEHLGKLFEPFHQGDASTTRKFGGTGLGLSISRRLVELMGGDLEVESEVGEGTVFKFEVLFRRADPAAVVGPVEETPARHEAEIELAKRLPARILLAEDNLINRKVAVKILERFGYDVEIAENGKQAVDRVANQSFDLVLMDMQMPEMDGLEATRKIRASDAQPRPRIVALTANASTEDRDACAAAGMDDFLSKPFTVHALVQCIERWGDSHE